MTTLIIDLDGTLSKYPGSDFRSLFTRYLESVALNKDDTKAAKFSVELMVNRYSAKEIQHIKEILVELNRLYGSLLILSLNYKIVAVEYLKELEILHLFDIDSSKFREDMSNKPRKEDVWLGLINKYENVIYIDDDSEVLGKLKTLDCKNVKFIHLPEWIGSENISIKDLLK